MMTIHNIALTEITLKMLFDSGIIKEGMIFFAVTDENRTAKINSEGSLEFELNGNNVSFPFPSGAAKALTGLNVNGWKFWKTIVNDETLEISDFRKMYFADFEVKISERQR